MKKKKVSKSLDRFNNLISRVRPLFSRVDWTSQGFTAEKAFIAAVFSKIAYLNIPQYELQYQKKVKIIPCLTYQDIVTHGIHLGIIDYLRALDFGGSFAFTTRKVAVVGVITPEVIIVALRGTRPLYVSDWIIDFNATKTKTHIKNKNLPKGYNVRLHSGFYMAISECLDRIETEILKIAGRRKDHPPVYLVGHSLGGALAAIAHALGGHEFYTHHRYGRYLRSFIPSHSCFSFGMPRYGNDVAVHQLRGPFHTYNDKDLVPGTPAKWMGYENALFECRAGPKGMLGLRPQPKQAFGWWLSRAHLARGLRYHFMERYIQRLCLTVRLC